MWRGGRPYEGDLRYVGDAGYVRSYYYCVGSANVKTFSPMYRTSEQQDKAEADGRENDPCHRHAMPVSTISPQDPHDESDDARTTKMKPKQGINAKTMLTIPSMRLVTACPDPDLAALPARRRCRDRALAARRFAARRMLETSVADPAEADTRSRRMAEAADRRQAAHSLDTIPPAAGSAGDNCHRAAGCSCIRS